jgi:hypothetical protein
MKEELKSTLIVLSLGLNAVLLVWLTVLSMAVLGNNQKFAGEISAMNESIKTVEGNVFEESESRKAADRYIGKRISERLDDED